MAKKKAVRVRYKAWALFCNGGEQLCDHMSGGRITAWTDENLARDWFERHRGSHLRLIEVTMLRCIEVRSAPKRRRAGRRK